MHRMKEAGLGDNLLKSPGPTLCIAQSKGCPNPALKFSVLVICYLCCWCFNDLDRQLLCLHSATEILFLFLQRLFSFRVRPRKIFGG